jgi:hypothetical protein
MEEENVTFHINSSAQVPSNYKLAKLLMLAYGFGNTFTWYGIVMLFLHSMWKC